MKPWAIGSSGQDGNSAVDLVANCFVSVMESDTLKLCESIKTLFLAGQLVKEEILSARLSCHKQRVCLGFS